MTSLLGQSASSYRVTHTYKLGGDGGWDYIVPDPVNHRLFIARQNRVMVVDEDNGTLLGDVTGIQGAHGTAVAESTGHGFATSGNDQSVVMFDLKTFKVLGGKPEYGATAGDGKVYANLTDTSEVVEIDAKIATVARRWPTAPCKQPVAIRRSLDHSPREAGVEGPFCQERLR